MVRFLYGRGALRVFFILVAISMLFQCEGGLEPAFAYRDVSYVSCV